MSIYGMNIVKYNIISLQLIKINEKIKIKNSIMASKKIRYSAFNTEMYVDYVIHLTV